MKIPGRRVFWLVLPVCVAVAGIATLLFAMPTKAQSSPYVWFCQMENGAAPVCSFGDYVDVHASASSGSLSWQYDPGDGSTYRFAVIVAPTDTVRLTATCSAYVFGVHTGSPCSTCLTNGSYQIGENDSAISVNTEPTVSGDTSSPTSTWQIVWWATNPGIGHRLPSAIPTMWTQADDYPYMRIRAAARGGGGGSATTGVGAACQVESYRLFDGSVHVPPVYVPPTPVPDPTPTPAGWIPKPYVPITWTTAPPQLGDFTFEPGEEYCYTLIPEFEETISVPFIFSDTIGWDDRGVCLLEWNLQSEFFQYDFDGFVYSFMSIILVFWMIRSFSSS